MGWPQIVSGTALTLCLVVLACFFGWQQLQNIRKLTSQSAFPIEEKSYYHYQVVLRLLTTLLLLVLALMLGYALIFLESRAQDLADFRDAGNPLRDSDRPFAEFYRWFWLLFLLLLLLLVVVAAIDLLTVRRWGLRQQRKIMADRRAMLNRQLQQLRQQHRNNGDPDSPESRDDE